MRGCRSRARGQGAALLLPPGQGHPPLADDGGEPAVELLDVAVEPGLGGRLPDLRVRGGLDPVGDVVGDRCREQERLLRHVPDRAAQLLEGPLLHALPVDGHRAPAAARSGGAAGGRGCSCRRRRGRSRRGSCRPAGRARRRRAPVARRRRSRPPASGRLPPSSSAGRPAGRRPERGGESPAISGCCERISSMRRIATRARCRRSMTQPL